MRGHGGRVLLVEANEHLRFAIRRFLTRRHFSVAEASDTAEARERFAATRPEVVILDHPLSDGDSFELLAGLRAEDPDLAAILLTDSGTVELAVEAVKRGVDQVLAKPVDMESLVVMTQRLCDTRADAQPQPRPGRSPGERDPFLGESDVIGRLREDALRVAAANLPVLIEGSTGSGKGVLARWLHDHGSRRDEAWVDLNCAGLSHQLLESELFGYERGAFTGAVSAKPGLLEVADQGTLFLDEVGDMGLEVQPRLLKVLEDKSFRRLGGVRGRDVDVRLLAATHHDLHERAEAGKFRLDLLYRIESVRLVVPPLAARGDDVLVLARDLIARAASASDTAPLHLAPTAEQALRAHSWPGNIRELRNVLERALLFATGSALDGEQIRSAIANGRQEAPRSRFHDPSLEAAERRHIEATLDRCEGDVRLAAELLGISRSGLYKKLRRHGLSPADATTH